MPAFRLLDLKCPSCGDTKADEPVSRDEDIPTCTCGTQYSVWWGGVHAVRKADGFAPITFEGVHYNTREEWDTYVRKVSGNIGKDIEVVSHNKHVARSRADDVRQQGWEHKRKLGVDDKLLREMAAERNARKAEARRR